MMVLNYGNDWTWTVAFNSGESVKCDNCGALLGRELVFVQLGKASLVDVSAGFPFPRPDLPVTCRACVTRKLEHDGL